MSFSINNQLHSINVDAIYQTCIQMKGWVGRKIQVIQTNHWHLQINDPAHGVGGILMGDILVCHIAFMIAKLVQPDDNYFEYNGNNYQAKLSALFGVCFVGGIFVVTRITKTAPLDNLSKAIVHIVGCSLGIVSLALLHGK